MILSIRREKKKPLGLKETITKGSIEIEVKGKFMIQISYSFRGSPLCTYYS